MPKGLVLVCLGLSAGLGAQTMHRPVAPPVRYPGLGPVGQGFGNVVFPGTGIPGRGHIENLGQTIRGVYPGTGPAGRRDGHWRTPVVPVIVGGYGYGYGYAAPPAAAPNVTVVNSPQPSPTVIINQHYTPDKANPVVRDYSNESLPEPSMQSYQAPVPSNPEGVRRASRDKPTIYLIALEDGTVYSAYAYWLEGETLHYVTTKHSLNQISMGLVDIDVSNQLNRERGVEFSVKK